MAENVLRTKSFHLAVRIIKLSEYLNKTHKAFDLAKQIFRSGTAIGAPIRESEYAETRRDFVHKLHIALKEANETEYWLDLLREANLVTISLYDSIRVENKELLKMLISSINTSKKKMNNEQ